MATPLDAAKKNVGCAAARRYIKSGMTVGLGTGSTVTPVIECLAGMIKSGEVSGIVGVPTSLRTEALASSLGIPLVSLDIVDSVDVAIDGADEIDNNLNVIKGLGGALFREKLVETIARIFVVVADESKLSNALGSKSVLPVEVNQFGWNHIMKKITSIDYFKSLGCTGKLRTVKVHDNNKNSNNSNIAFPYISDNNNYIIDFHFQKPMDDVAFAANLLTNVVGVVEHGLFVNFATHCVIGREDGSVGHRAKDDAEFEWSTSH